MQKHRGEDPAIIDVMAHMNEMPVLDDIQDRAILLEKDLAAMMALHDQEKSLEAAHIVTMIYQKMIVTEVLSKEEGLSAAVHYIEMVKPRHKALSLSQALNYLNLMDEDSAKIAFMEFLDYLRGVPPFVEVDHDPYNYICKVLPGFVDRWYALERSVNLSRVIPTKAFIAIRARCKRELVSANALIIEKGKAGDRHNFDELAKIYRGPHENLLLSLYKYRACMIEYEDKRSGGMMPF